MDEVQNSCVLYRLYSEAQPPLLPDLYRLFDNVSRTLLATIAGHMGLRTDAFFDLVDDVSQPRSTIGCSLTSIERVGMGGRLQELQEGEVRVGRGFFTLVAAEPYLKVTACVRRVLILLAS